MPHSPIRNISRCALLAALLCLCGWMAIPLPGISVTMQTFGVFLALELLGGAWGTAAVLTYLLLGLAGLPVFTGFQGGITVLLGPTGGFLWGFLTAGLIYWAVTALLPGRKLAAMILGLVGCYACGTCWYVFGYLNQGPASLSAALLTCVVPYLIPDLLKLFLAHHLGQKLQRFAR